MEVVVESLERAHVYDNEVNENVGQTKEMGLLFSFTTNWSLEPHHNMLNLMAP